MAAASFTRLSPRTRLCSKEGTATSAHFEQQQKHKSSEAESSKPEDIQKHDEYYVRKYGSSNQHSFLDDLPFKNCQ
jgi:hypothetical protein